MPKLLIPISERRTVPTAVRRTGKTLRLRGNLDINAAMQFFALSEDQRRCFKFLDMTDVGDVYPSGFLPIAAYTALQGLTPKLRIVENANVQRYLNLYGYDNILQSRVLDNLATLPQSIKHFTEDGPSVHEYVTKSVDNFLERAPNSDRSGAQSLEWALGELTGNVFHHAESTSGLFAQCLIQPKSRRCIFSLVDFGIGVRKSLERAMAVSSDKQAIELAIQQGITSKRGNQGWGLFGSSAIVEASRGNFVLWSGTAALFINPDGGRQYREDMPLFPGTLIEWRMPTDARLNLQDVLQIKNEPLTLLWDRYDEGPGIMRFRIADEARNFLDRPTGKRLRTKLINITRSAAQHRCVVDFSGVRMITSSFADEFLGQFAVLLGEARYKEFVRLDNINEVVLGILNGAIQERLRTEKRATTPLQIRGYR